MKKKNSNKGSVKTFLKVLKYLKIYRLHFAVSLLLTAISVALTLYIPILVGQAIDLCIDKGRVDFDGVSTILIKIGVCILITALAQWIINVLNN